MPKRIRKKKNPLHNEVLGVVADLFKICKQADVNLVVFTDFGYDEFATYYANGTQPDYMNRLMIQINGPEKVPIVTIRQRNEGREK